MATKPAVGATLNTGHALASGMVLCLVFNENAGTSGVDLVSSISWDFVNESGSIWTTGPSGPAILMTQGVSRVNNQYITVNNAASIQLTGNLTIVTGIQPTSNCLGVATLFSEKGTDTAGPVTYGIGWNTDNLLAYNRETNILGAGSHNFTGQAGIYVNVFVSNTSNTLQYYVNNVDRGSVPIGPPGGGIDNTNTLGIGSRGSGAGGFNFDGIIDYFYLYSRALTPQEASDLNTNPFAMLTGPGVDTNTYVAFVV